MPPARTCIAGVKANYKGSVVGEEYTRWPDQLDFSAELAKARAAKPDAVFAFYPGAAGIQFLTQYAQAGLQRQIPLYTSFIIDALSLPRLKDLAVGVPSAQHWVIDLPNEANKKFVEGLQEQIRPQAVVLCRAGLRRGNLIASAVDGGEAAMSARRTRCAPKCGRRTTPRCAGRTNTATTTSRSRISICRKRSRRPTASYTLKTVATALTAHQDRYHDRCPMK